MMNTNFAFLSGSKKCNVWFDYAEQAEEHLWNDPHTSGFKIRYLSEMILDSIYREVGLHVSKHATIEEKIDNLSEMRVLPLTITSTFHCIRGTGNKAGHPNNGPYTTSMAREGLERLRKVAVWYY